MGRFLPKPVGKRSNKSFKTAMMEGKGKSHAETISFKWTIIVYMQIVENEINGYVSLKTFTQSIDSFSLSLAGECHLTAGKFNVAFNLCCHVITLTFTLH